MQHLRNHDPVVAASEEIEAQQNVGEVFAVSEVRWAQRLDVDRPKALRDALSQ